MANRLVKIVSMRILVRLTIPPAVGKLSLDFAITTKVKVRITRKVLLPPERATS